MMKHNLDRNSLEKLYFGFIRPILEYGSVVWALKLTHQSDAQVLRLFKSDVTTDIYDIRVVLLSHSDVTSDIYDTRVVLLSV
jgi:hypothetical protein